jgi:hypothetical protein
VSFTYSLADLLTSPKDQIRAELQDTDVNNQRLQDEEIALALATERNTWSAAARCAEMIARNYLMKADVRLGRSMQITYTKMAQQYLEMAKCLRQKALGTTPPFVGGMSVSAKQAYAQDTDLVAPFFSRTQMENPWTGGYTSDSLGPTPSEEDDAGDTF